jgi:ABC-type Fe3+-siderophore transport system permease subunit
LSLAILLCLMLFVVFPLLRLGFDAALQTRLSGLSGPLALTPDTTMTPLAAGGAVDLITPVRLLIEGGSALTMLGLCVLAWRGRPSWGRHLLTVAVVAMAVLAGTSIVQAIGQTPTVNAGVSSGDGLIGSLRWTQLILTVLVPLYVVWYINRAPARAFYRQESQNAPSEMSEGGAVG